MFLAALAWRASVGADTILEDYEFTERAQFAEHYPEGEARGRGMEGGGMVIEVAGGAQDCPGMQSEVESATAGGAEGAGAACPSERRGDGPCARAGWPPSLRLSVREALWCAYRMTRSYKMTHHSPTAFLSFPLPPRLLRHRPRGPPDLRAAAGEHRPVGALEVHDPGAVCAVPRAAAGAVLQGGRPRGDRCGRAPARAVAGHHRHGG